MGAFGDGSEEAGSKGFEDNPIDANKLSPMVVDELNPLQIGWNFHLEERIIRI
jgi:hypothetical protein